MCLAGNNDYIRNLSYRQLFFKKGGLHVLKLCKVKR